MIATDRLILTPPTLDDAPAIFRLRSDPEVAVHLNRKLQTEFEEAEAFIANLTGGFDEGKWHYWLVKSREDNTFLGTICLWNFSEDRFSAEVGYELLPQYQGKGFAGEALGAVLEFGFGALGLGRIDAIIEAPNGRSISLAERFGFKVIREFEEVSVHDGSPVKCLVYSLDRSAYEIN
ncbi:MAG: putative N-acetyltransferase YoaA [Ignavibacteriaceae bacterium]|nr:MAG: N-acetyltransferase [Chlorobiota bacterium]GJQ33465.1 MAG: putative N-acetyltransferase YoaA [Ignavibacteriaceae bacterium]